MKKFQLIYLFEFLLFQNLEWSVFSTVAVIIFSHYLFQLVLKSNEIIAFRELALLFFSLNYLLSPALMYNGLDKFQMYKMVLPEEEYFLLAIPAMLFLNIGMFALRTKMFNKDLSIVKTAAKYNVDILKSWIFVGLILRFMSGFLPSEGAFFIYLLSSIRFLGAFGLLTIDFKKYKLYIVMVLGFEILSSVREGMFHDMILWLIFLALLVSYLYKPKLYIKIIVILVGVSFLFLLQITKSDYRSRTWQGNQDAGLETFKSSIESSTSKSEGFFDIETMASSVSRVNQAWIFASTVDNLQRTQEFQSFSLLGRYLEAALLPRFLAPNKLNAGSREIFNQFSGRFIDVGTSMALGLFADGYVSFGTAGVYLFALGFGLIFCLVFRIVDGWSKISPFFIFFLFPILHYAIRSDCETQTVLGHIVKGTFLFGLMVLYYKNYFSVQEKMLKKEKVILVALSGKLSTQ